jgi:pentatricopeptide repeat protein
MFYTKSVSNRCDSVIASLASSKDNRFTAADKADQLLKQLKDRYEAGEKLLRPNSYTYNSVINGWARAGKPDHAENVLKEMYEDFIVNSNSSAAPKTDSFNSKYQCVHI